MPLQTTIRLNMTAALRRTMDLSTPVDELTIAKTVSLPTGTGSGQADQSWHDERVIDASASETLDLAGGSLVDAFGTALTFVKLKSLLVVADPANTNDVQVTRPGNGAPIFLASGHGIAVPPSGVHAAVWPGAGITITANTGDLIQIANSGAGTSVRYKISLIGTSA